jgi:hypothetical protein
MKLTHLFLLFCLLPFFFSCAVSMQSIGTSMPGNKTLENAEKTVQNQDILEIDTIAFEVNDRLPIRQKLAEKIAEYQRIPNPNYTVLSAKVFSNRGKLLYTLVPNTEQNSVRVYIKDRHGKKGMIEMTSKPELGFGSVTIRYSNKADFFGRPYHFDFYSKSVMTAGFSPNLKSRLQYVLYYNDTPVLAYIANYDMSDSNNNKINVIADHEFLKGHKDEVAAWCVLFVLLQDVNKKLTEDSTIRNAGNNFMNDDSSHMPTGPDPIHTPPPVITPPPTTHWNNNGTIDNNGNPFDNF